VDALAEQIELLHPVHVDHHLAVQHHHVRRHRLD
jgi:hypothetical protein